MHVNWRDCSTACATRFGAATTAILDVVKQRICPPPQSSPTRGEEVCAWSPTRGKSSRVPDEEEEVCALLHERGGSLRALTGACQRPGKCRKNEKGIDFGTFDWRRLHRLSQSGAGEAPALQERIVAVVEGLGLHGSAAGGAPTLQERIVAVVEGLGLQVSTARAPPVLQPHIHIKTALISAVFERARFFSCRWSRSSWGRVSSRSCASVRLL